MIDFIIDPSEFRHPIEIQKSTIGKNSDGIPVDIWTSLIEPKPRAKIINANGDEYSKALGTGSKIEKTFYIRYSNRYLITNDNRIIYNNQIFNIKYVNNIKEMNRYIEIRGEMVE